MKKVIAILGIATVDGMAAAAYAAVIYPMTFATVAIAHRIWQQATKTKTE